MKKLFITIVSLALTACSSVPVAIKTAPEPDVQLAEVAGTASKLIGTQVRWGGRVIKVENDNDGSVIHVAQFPLNSYGKPQIDKDSQGRFLAHSTDFIDPYIYKEGTLLTVAGQITELQTLTIDRKQLSVPMVRIDELYRWPLRRYIRDHYPYYWPGYPGYDYFGYGLYYPGPRTYWRYYHGLYW